MRESKDTFFIIACAIICMSVLIVASLVAV